MKIVFMSGGARHMALETLIQNGFEVVAVITPVITEKNSRFEKVILTAAKNGIAVYPIQKDRVFDILIGIKFDVLISCGYTSILDEKVLNLSKYNINVHPTLLPTYRGPRSGPFIIKNNEPFTGVTVHYITKKMDDGDILGQVKIPLNRFDTTKSMSRKTSQIEGDLLVTTLKKLQTNEIVPTKQDETKATTFNYMRTPKDSEIDPTKSLLELYDDIRAADPNEYPAFFHLENQKICIQLWRPDKDESEQDMI